MSQSCLMNENFLIQSSKLMFTNTSRYSIVLVLDLGLAVDTMSKLSIVFFFYFYVYGFCGVTSLLMSSEK